RGAAPSGSPFGPGAPPGPSSGPHLGRPRGTRRPGDRGGRLWRPGTASGAVRPVGDGRAMNLHPEVCATALAGLPGMGPAGLVGVLAERSPVEAWTQVRDGRLGSPSP